MNCPPLRLAAPALVLGVLLGCGAPRAIKEKLTPKASVLGVSIVEVTPEHTVVRVDVKTDDVNLLLGMVKLRYRFAIQESAQEQQGDVAPGQLVALSKSGVSFLVKVPHTGAIATGNRFGILVQGALVFKVITEIADIPFSYKGELDFKS